MFNRPTVALPQYLGEVGSNRWIWVRNGLATKEVLVTDELLRQVLEREPLLQARLNVLRDHAQLQNQKRGEAAYLGKLREAITVNFTGADVYSFWITVKDTDPFLAERINQSILDRLINIEVKKPIEGYQAAITQLEQRLNQLKVQEKSIPPHLEENRRVLSSLNKEIERIEATSQHLHIAVMLMRAEKSNQFNLIVEPTAEVDPVWPQPPLIYLIATLIGLFCVSLTIYCSMVFQRRTQRKS